MTVKIVERHDPGHKGTKVRVNFDHVSWYSDYRPQEMKGEIVKGYTVLVMSNGSVILGKIDIKTVDQIMGVK